MKLETCPAFHFCALCALLWQSLSCPTVFGGEAYTPETDPLVLRKLEQWQDLKFGLLMHWGPYSQWGIVESWSICSEDEPWCRRKIPDYEAYKKQYVALKNSFNPVRFDPEKWARAAKAAGMRYVVFTTKHHDGFCMFDTKTTDYKITDPACPFSVNTRSNVTREIFRAFHSFRGGKPTVLRARLGYSNPEGRLTHAEPTTKGHKGCVWDVGNLTIQSRPI